MEIGFPIPTKNKERRRALLTEHIRGLKSVAKLVFESGYGSTIGSIDEDYIRCGAKVADRKTVCECPIICNPKPVVTDEYFQEGKTLFGWIHAVQGRQITDLLVNNKMTAIAWEDMFECQRYVFWRNREIAGEAAIIHAFNQWGRLPYECKVSIVGQGMVSRGAVRMLERFGCNVTVYDKKTSPLLRDEIGQYDVVVNAVLWDVFRKDHLVYEEDLAKMKPGSLIIDISCDEGMGIETSHPTTVDNPVYWHHGILHYAVDNTPSLFYKSSSISISNAIVRFVDDLIEQKQNPTIEKATIIHNGVIMDKRIKNFQNR